LLRILTVVVEVMMKQITRVGVPLLILAVTVVFSPGLVAEPKAEYCTDIPDIGDTFLVVDLVDPGLRTLPVGVKIIRGVNENDQDEAMTVAYWKPVSHPDGILRGEARLEKGLYKLIITAEGLSPSAYLLRVQQVDYSKLGRSALGPLALLLVLGVVGYELSKSSRMRNWWASRRRS
jgi:hypothetical protein